MIVLQDFNKHVGSEIPVAERSDLFRFLLSQTKRDLTLSKSFASAELNQIGKLLQLAIEAGYQETLALLKLSTNPKKGTTANPQKEKTMSTVNTTLPFKEAKYFITLEYDGTRSRTAYTNFLSQCDIAWDLCAKEDQGFLLQFICTRIVGGASVEISGKYSTWAELRIVLETKFGESESFEQQLYRLVSSHQRPNENISSFGNRCLDFQVRMLQSIEKVEPKITSTADLIRFLVKQIFTENCQPQMSQFLRYTQAQAHCDTQALILKATHEEEKLGNIRKSANQNASKSFPNRSENRSKQWCSHCKNGSHATNDCKSKTISTCSYCKNKGHEENECRKKKAASYSRTTQIHKTHTKLFCRYCKSDEHEIADCEVLKRKKGQDMPPPNKDVRKVQIVKIRAVEVEDEEPEPYIPNDAGSILIKLESPELERTFVFQIDTGAKVSLIHKNRLPSHVILDDSIKLRFSGIQRTKEDKYTVGFVWIPVRLGEHLSEIRMHVIEEDDIQLDYDGIIGYSFCEGNAIIDCYNQTVQFPYYDFVAPFYCRSTLLPPFTKKVMAFKVTGRSTNTGLVKITNLPKEAKVLDSVAQKRQGNTVIVPVANMSNESLDLSRCRATLEPFESIIRFHLVKSLNDTMRKSLLQENMRLDHLPENEKEELLN